MVARLSRKQALAASPATTGSVSWPQWSVSFPLCDDSSCRDAPVPAILLSVGVDSSHGSGMAYRHFCPDTHDFKMRYTR